MMKKLFLLLVTALFLPGFFTAAAEAKNVNLEGTWKQISYVKADSQVRFQTEGYMIFGKKHWLHASYFNRDARQHDFAEAHHGTYEVTGPDTLNLFVDIELHMDPKSEFQKAPVYYGPSDNIKGAKYQWKGKQLVVDLPSGAQLVLEKIE